MRHQRKNPRLCLLLNSSLWCRCSLRKCGSPRCSCPFLYKYWYSAVSSSSTYCPAVQGLQLMTCQIRDDVCIACGCHTQLDLAPSPFAPPGHPASLPSLVPTSTANPSFISAATSATSVPLSIVASTKFSTSFTVSASICWPVRIYTGPVHGVPLFQTCLIAIE